MDNAENADKTSSERAACCKIHDHAACQVEILDSFSRAVSAVVEAVAPAVVSITTHMEARSAAEPFAQQGSGSGVVIAPDGYLLTNAHVVHNAQSVSVKLTDGSVRPAMIVGEDPPTDLAVLRAVASGLPFAEMGDSNPLKTGQMVIAVGNPLGLESTVSTGVISSLGRALRSISGRLIENVIQHTAPLNPGSSGGPLVNTRGQVVGINTAIIAAAQGIGFAIPSSTATWVLSQLMTQGKVTRGYLGIVGASRPLSRRTVRVLNLRNEHAVVILEVVEGSPAAQAGVQTGDLLLRIGDSNVASMDDVYRFLTGWPAGKPVRLAILRMGEYLDLDVRPSEGEAG